MDDFTYFQKLSISNPHNNIKYWILIRHGKELHVLVKTRPTGGIIYMIYIEFFQRRLIDIWDTK